MRGRLIQRFLAVVHRLDPAATAAVPGGGYDADFDEPLQVADGTQQGAPSRREMPAVRIPCQLDRKEWEGATLTRGGYQEETQPDITFHWPDLVRLGLVDANGRALLQPGDRIDAIETIRGQLEVRFPNPPGVFITSVERAGHGLDCFGTPRSNLLIAQCAIGRAEGGFA